MFTWLKQKGMTFICACLLTFTFSTSAFALAIGENEINQLLKQHNHYKNSYGIPGLAGVDYNLHDLMAYFNSLAINFLPN